MVVVLSLGQSTTGPFFDPERTEPIAWVTTQRVVKSSCKVQIFWEGHKNSARLPVIIWLLSKIPLTPPKLYGGWKPVLRLFVRLGTRQQHSAEKNTSVSYFYASRIKKSISFPHFLQTFLGLLVISVLEIKAFSFSFYC